MNHFDCVPQTVSRDWRGHTDGEERLNETRDAAAICDKYGKRIITMAKIVKVIEVLSESPRSWEDAVQGVVDEASKTLRNIRSVYIKEFTAAVENKKVTGYRVNAKVTFEMERGK